MKKLPMILLSILIIAVLAWALFSDEKDIHASTIKSSLAGWLKMRLKEGGLPEVSRSDVNSVSEKVNIELVNSPSSLPRATWIGHATMLVQYQGVNFLTDPHLTQYPSPVDFFVQKRLVPPALDYHHMPDIDFVVISHNHFDHLDHRTVDMFGNSVVWYVPSGLKKWFIGRGINPDKVVELAWWQSHQFNKEVRVTLTPSVHWSKRTPWDTNASLWGAWSVNISGFNSWFAGDTGYDEKLFKEIGERTGPYHLSFIPIGAYAPRYFMLKQHVDPYYAIRIHKDINSTKSIPIHWGTFQLTHEPYMEPPALLESEMSKAGLPLEQFEPIRIGQTIEIEIESLPVF